MKASMPSNTFNFSKLPPPKKREIEKKEGRGGRFQKPGTDNSIVENNDAISASCAVFTPLTKGLSPKHREGRIERSLSKLCFHHDRLDRTFVNRTVYRDTHYSNRCLSRCSHLRFQFSNLRLTACHEERKREKKNSRSIDHPLSLDVSIYLCRGGRAADGSVTESALNQDSRVCWAVSTSWQTPFDTRDQLPDRASGRFFRARERKKEKRKKRRENRLTLHVTQIGRVDRNGDCSMKWNGGALREPRDCFASNRCSDETIYSMMVYQ